MRESKTMLRVFMIAAAVAVFVLARAFATFENQIRITDAIFAYNMDCIHHGIERDVSYDDAESINKTFWRAWDWGAKRILPREKYMKILPYIGADISRYEPMESRFERRSAE